MCKDCEPITWKAEYLPRTITDPAELAGRAYLLVCRLKGDEETRMALFQVVEAYMGYEGVRWAAMAKWMLRAARQARVRPIHSVMGLPTYI